MFSVSDLINTPIVILSDSKHRCFLIGVKIWRQLNFKKMSHTIACLALLEVLENHVCYGMHTHSTHEWGQLSKIMLIYLARPHFKLLKLLQFLIGIKTLKTRQCCLFPWTSVWVFDVSAHSVGRVSVTPSQTNRAVLPRCPWLNVVW